MCHYHDTLYACGCNSQVLTRRCSHSAMRPSSQPCPRTRVVALGFSNEDCEECHNRRSGGGAGVEANTKDLKRKREEDDDGERIRDQGLW